MEKFSEAQKLLSSDDNDDDEFDKYLSTLKELDLNDILIRCTVQLRFDNFF